MLENFGPTPDLLGVSTQLEPGARQDEELLEGSQRHAGERAARDHHRWAAADLIVRHGIDAST